jgi:hypothetical protein
MSLVDAAKEHLKQVAGADVDRQRVIGRRRLAQPAP